MNSKVFINDLQKNLEVILNELGIAGGQLVKYDSQADVKVFIVKYESQANIKITQKNFPKWIDQMAKRKRHAKIIKSKRAWSIKIKRLQEITSQIKAKELSKKNESVKKLASKSQIDEPLSTGQYISVAAPFQNIKARKEEEAKRVKQEKLYAEQKAREIGRGNPPKEPVEFHSELGEDPIHQ